MVLPWKSQIIPIKGWFLELCIVPVIPLKRIDVTILSPDILEIKIIFIIHVHDLKNFENWAVAVSVHLAYAIKAGSKQWSSYQKQDFPNKIL